MRGLGQTPYAAPQIQFPAEINRRGERVVSVRRVGRLPLQRLIDTRALACDIAVRRAAGGELRIKFRARSNRAAAAARF